MNFNSCVENNDNDSVPLPYLVHTPIFFIYSSDHWPVPPPDFFVVSCFSPILVTFDTFRYIWICFDTFRYINVIGRSKNAFDNQICHIVVVSKYSKAEFTCITHGSVTIISTSRVFYIFLANILPKNEVKPCLEI